MLSQYSWPFGCNQHLCAGFAKHTARIITIDHLQRSQRADGDDVDVVVVPGDELDVPDFDLAAYCCLLYTSPSPRDS